MKHVALCLLLLPVVATAQSRGRTDGAEGSEIGTGGYSSLRPGSFALEASWGASILSSQYTPSDAGPPLFFGLTASYLADDWFQLDLSGVYLLNDNRFNIMAGPRFRTYGWPVSFHAGLKAGAIVLQSPEFYNNATVRFGLSPQVGADVLFANDHLITGLAYAIDIPFGGGGVANRIFLNVGYRF